MSRGVSVDARCSGVLGSSQGSLPGGLVVEMGRESDLIPTLEIARERQRVVLETILNVVCMTDSSEESRLNNRNQRWLRW